MNTTSLATKTSGKLTIVFFGSGPVAARSLELLAEEFDIEAVVTKPKPAHHRGAFPVIYLAERLGLPLKTVSNKAELSELISTKPFSSQLGVLIDFGIIVGPDVIDYFPLGIINSHFSLLPEWRGADPITFSILSGQAKTGVSLMLIDEGMDTGKLLTQKSHPIPPDATTASLTAELIDLSHSLLKEYIPAYVDGSVKPRQQPHPNRATYSRKLTKEDGRLDWDKPAEQLEREIRAFKDWPKSYTALGGKGVIITKAHTVPTNSPEAQPGDLEVVKDVGIIMVNTSKGSLCIERIKPAGGKEMSAESFINGYMP